MTRSGLRQADSAARVRRFQPNVQIRTTGTKLHHPVVGNLDLPFETFPLAADPSQSLFTHTAEPGSPLAPRPEPAGQLARHSRRLRAAYVDEDSEQAESVETPD